MRKRCFTLRSRRQRKSAGARPVLRSPLGPRRAFCLWTVGLGPRRSEGWHGARGWEAAVVDARPSRHPHLLSSPVTSSSPFGLPFPSSEPPCSPRLPGSAPPVSARLRGPPARPSSVTFTSLGPVTLTPLPFSATWHSSCPGVAFSAHYGAMRWCCMGFLGLELP